MDGFLAKQSSSAWSAKGWTERYVAVEGSSLKYYEPSFDEAGAPRSGARGSIQLEGAEVIDQDELSFVVKKSGKATTFRADGADLKKLWVVALRRAANGEPELRGARTLDSDADYALLGLAPPGGRVARAARDAFTDRQIASAYTAVIANNRGAPGSREKCNGALQRIVAARRARQESRRCGSCVFRGYATKHPETGFGIAVDVRA